YDEAFSVRELGSVDDAKQLLDLGYKVIEKFSPNMMRLLAAMASFSRMVSAMAPVTPLRPRDFKLAQIVSLAYLNGLLHQFLVSTAERYRLRLYILGRSFALGSRYLLDSTQRIIQGEPEADREWEQIQAIREDFQTLTDESLESLKALLTSLAAERREDVLRRLWPAERRREPEPPELGRRPKASLVALLAPQSPFFPAVQRRSTRSISGRRPGTPCVSRTTPTPGAIHSEETDPGAFSVQRSA